jgi:hypothetical protein
MLGEVFEYKGEWFRIGGGPRERFTARYPTVTEKLEMSAVEPSFYSGNGKPGEARTIHLDKLQRNYWERTLPLLNGYERESGETFDGDWVRAQLQESGGGAYVEEVVKLGSHLFRPSTSVDKEGTGDTQGAS